MTTDEIFQQLSERSIKGVMFHDYLVDYFNFLNLHGYKRMSEYHAKHEMKSFRKIHRYYIDHYNKLVPDVRFENTEIIPATWYEHVRSDVDTETIRKSVREAFEKWHEWEKGTKAFYQQMYKELCDLGEIASALKISKLIKSVDKELKWVCRKHLDLKSMDYSIGYIQGEQKFYHDFYKGKE